MQQTENIYCTKCNLGCHHDTGDRLPIVPGCGSENADLMLVGMNPGYHEQQRLIPFIGDAGQILDEDLWKAQIDRDECWVTNIIKHVFPPKQKKPNKKQLEACRPFLLAEIEMVKPKVIVALGSDAIKFFTGINKVAAQRGRPVQLGEEFGNAILMPTYHPSAFNYNPHNRNIFQEDLKKTKTLLERGMEAFHGTDVTVVRTLRDLEPFLERLVELDRFAIDLETTITTPFEGLITDISLCCEEGKSFVVPLVNFDGTDFIPYAEQKTIDFIEHELIRNRDIKKITHGGCFDWKWLLVKEMVSYGEVFDSWDMDTLYFHAALIDEEPPHNLEHLAGHYLNMPAWDATKRQIEKEFGAGAVYRLPMRQRADYAGGDGDATWRLDPVLRQVALDEREDALDFWYNVVRDALPAYTEMSVNGMRIDAERLDTVRSIFKAQLRNIDKRLRKVLGCSEDVNLSPRPQLVPYLENIGIKFPDKKWYLTKTGKPSLRDAVRKALAEDQPHEVWDILRDRTKLDKLINSFVGKSNESTRKTLPAMICEPTGRIHCSLNPHGARTGRRSHTNPNLSQTPKRQDPGSEVEPQLIRTCFIPTYDDEVIVKADFETAEFWIGGHISGDPKMMEVFDMGRDVHSMTGAEIYGIPYDEFYSGYKSNDEEIVNMRLRAKILNFGGIMYGGGARKIARDINASVEDAQKLMNELEKVYEVFFAWKREQIARISPGGPGWVETLWGRRRHARITADMPYHKRAHKGRQICNAPIQGTMADHMLKVVPIVREALHSQFRGRIIMEMHDELLTSVHRDDAEAWLPIMLEAMTLDVPRVGKPLPVGGDIVTRWREI